MRLIDKTLYETFIAEGDSRHPIQILGELYVEHVQNDADLSSVRFVQGEVYYHFQDFESAIYKWRKVDNELKSWAIKNMADAYRQLGNLKEAEEAYASVSSNEKVLDIEIALQLFSLYVETNNREGAYEQIETALKLDPDYLGVTEMAKQFYEEQNDWKKAVSLAIHEAIRTESLEWFAVVRSYIEEERIEQFLPKSFYTLLICTYQVDRRYFHSLTSLLWAYYREKDSYIDWLHTLNDIFLNIEIELYDAWYDTSVQYERTFYELIEGAYSVNVLQSVMPNLLTNWLKVTTTSKALPAVSAVLAWNELFPNTLPSQTVEEAEQLIEKAGGDFIYREELMTLLKQIETWGERNQLKIGNKLKWLVQEMATSDAKHIVIGNMLGHSHSILSLVTNGQISYKEKTDLALIQYSDKETVHFITNQEMISNKEDEVTSPHFMDVHLSSSMLERLNCKLMELPKLHRNDLHSREYTDLLSLADGIVLCFQTDDLFQEGMQDALMTLKDFVEENVHFVLTVDVGKVFHSKEAARQQLEPIFPNSSILWAEGPISYEEQLFTFIQQAFKTTEPKEEGKRTSQLLKLMRQIASNLAYERVKLEKDLTSTIDHKNRLLERLNGFQLHLQDVESEQMMYVRNSYHQLIQNQKELMKKEIPQLLQQCKDLITEESDFRQLHSELNEAMNERIHTYLYNQYLPRFRGELEDWLFTMEQEFENIQHNFDEMSDTLNRQAGSQVLAFKCDQKVIEDWKRDIYRMTAKTYVEKENIMLRLNPSQIMLKGAGKLLGVIQKNKDLLVKQYRKYIEQERFSEVTSSIVQKFFVPFEVFERALEQDVDTFFTPPKENVQDFVQKMEAEVKEHRELLQYLSEHYEDFEDPHTLIKLKLRQWEWMKQPKRNVTPVSE